MKMQSKQVLQAIQERGRTFSRPLAAYHHRHHSTRSLAWTRSLSCHRGVSRKDDVLPSSPLLPSFSVLRKSCHSPVKAGFEARWFCFRRTSQLPFGGLEAVPALATRVQVSTVPQDRKSTEDPQITEKGFQRGRGRPLQI